MTSYYSFIIGISEIYIEIVACTTLTLIDCRSYMFSPSLCTPDWSSLPALEPWLTQVGSPDLLRGPGQRKPCGTCQCAMQHQIPGNLVDVPKLNDQWTRYKNIKWLFIFNLGNHQHVISFFIFLHHPGKQAERCFRWMEQAWRSGEVVWPSISILIYLQITTPFNSRLICSWWLRWEYAKLIAGWHRCYPISDVWSQLGLSFGVERETIWILAGLELYWYPSEHMIQISRGQWYPMSWSWSVWPFGILRPLLEVILCKIQNSYRVPKVHRDVI